MDKGLLCGKNSIISDDVEIGEGSKIWHFCNLYGCKIGKNTQIGSYTEIKKGVEIGDNCRVQSYVFIPKGTKIGNGVFIGPRVTFGNDKYPTAQGAISGNWVIDAVIVEDDVSIGLGAIILPGVKIGKGSVIGAGSIVTKNVLPGQIVCGNPAKNIGKRYSKKYRDKFK